MVASNRDYLTKTYHWLIILFPLSMLGKQIAVMATMSSAILLFFLNIFLTAEKIRVPIFFKVALTLCILLIVRSIFTDFPVIALKKSVTLLVYVMFALVIQNIKDRTIYPKIFFFLCIFLIALSLDGVIQVIFGKDFLNNRAPLKEGYLRINGPFSGVGFSSSLALFALPIFNLIPIDKSLRKRIAYFSIIICSFVMIVLSGERSGVYLFVLGIALSFLLNPSISRKHYIIFGIFLIIFLSLLSIKNLNIRYRISLENILKSEYLTQWKHGLNLFYNNMYSMFFGIGPHHYHKYCDISIDPTCRHKHPHSIYIEILLDLGIIGGALLLLMFVLLIHKFSKFYINTRDVYIKTIASAIMVPILARILLFPSNISFVKYAYAAPFWFMVGLLLSVIGDYNDKKITKIS